MSSTRHPVLPLVEVVTALVGFAEEHHGLLLVLRVVLHLVSLPHGGLLQEAARPHQDLLHVVLRGHGEVGIIRGRPELVAYIAFVE